MNLLAKTSSLYINELTFVDPLILKNETPYTLLLFHLEKQERFFQKEKELQEIEKQIEQLIVNTRLTQTYKNEIYHLTKKINELKMDLYTLQRRETGVFHYLIHSFNHNLQIACHQELRISSQKIDYFYEQAKAVQTNPLFEEYLYEKQQKLRKECVDIQDLLARSTANLCCIYFRFLAHRESGNPV